MQCRLRSLSDHLIWDTKTVIIFQTVKVKSAGKDMKLEEK